MMSLKHTLQFLGCLALAVSLASSASARQEFGDFEISGELFNFMELRFGGKRGPEVFNLSGATPSVLGTPSNAEKFDNLNSWRTELTLEVVYNGIKHVTPVLRLRPYYDAAYNIEDGNHIQDHWKTNLSDGLNNDWDPLVREAFVDINFHPLFIRAGRQIVTWGRSDGVVVLDVVNPRNFRNPLTFEQERFMIPQWMINASLDFSQWDWMPGGIQKELQVIWNLQYLPSRFPGFHPDEEGRHPWSLNVVDLAIQIANVSTGLFGEPGTFFDSNRWDRGNFFDKNEVFVRWRGRTGGGLGPLSDMTYSFHYARLFEDVPFYELNDRIDAGFAINIAGPRAIGGGIDFDRHRYDMMGFSMDKGLMFLPGQLQGTVFRLETAYNFENKFYDPSFHLVKRDNVTYLIGLDQYLYLSPRRWIETPWFVSFQFWQDWITKSPGPGKFTNLGTAACMGQSNCGTKGYVIGGATNVFNGLRRQHRSIVTLFMFNDFLPGKTLHVELFALHEIEKRGTWFRGVVGYAFNSNFSARVGTNLITGPRDSFFGQFEKNKLVFTELKYTF